MPMRKPLRFSWLPIAAALVAACNAPPQKTVLLPADGGDLGQAFTTLQTALAAGDDARADKLLDPKWHVAGDGSSYSALLKGLKPTGGKRRGDRATLFLLGEQYAALNASHGANGWYFDLPTPMFFSANKNNDCTASPQRFPCGVTSAPDSEVTGTATEQYVSMSGTKEVKTMPFFDGFAVREVSVGKKTPLSTRLILSPTAVDPQVLARSSDPLEVTGDSMRVALDIAPDGKSARGSYKSNTGYTSRLEFEVKDGEGLSLDTSQPKRLRGRVTAEIKGVKLDITFDVGVTSEHEESNMAL